MRFKAVVPPRVFGVGPRKDIRLKDCARIELSPDEQVTFLTENGSEYDLARKSWGYYATPSLNRRLKGFGLRAVLARSGDGRFYILAVQAGKEDEFHRYMEAQRQIVVRWLDDDRSLEELAAWAAPAESASTRCLCGSTELEPLFHYDAAPTGEVRFAFSAGASYRRDVLRCARCRHMRSVHAMDAGSLYTQGYVDATYGADGIQKAFERINAIDPTKSDNIGRVARVLEFARAELGDRRKAPTILDVGSGLCVFLHRMKAAGWDGTALDPDPRAAEHARSLGLKAVTGDFMRASELGTFDAITFNKILEHVPYPIEMLARAKALVKPNGFIYVELPDGECSAAEGPGREEFFIDHHHIFSAASTAILAARAGFTLRVLERLREPSTKFTLRAFLLPTTPGADAEEKR